MAWKSAILGNGEDKPVQGNLVGSLGESRKSVVRWMSGFCKKWEIGRGRIAQVCLGNMRVLKHLTVWLFVLPLAAQTSRGELRLRMRYQVAPRFWVAAGGEYGSGLPFEFTGTYRQALAEYGQAVVDRLNFDRGRVRPSLAVDVSSRC